MSKKKLKPKELSALWDISLATLSQWRWTGQGPTFMKLGKRIRYRKEDVDVFEIKKLRENTAKSE